MQPKFSIIVPVYNTELFLPECLDSCINQTYKNLEIIIINDGSPDNSEDIILEYQARDARIKYIKQDNSGVFAAYRNGFDNASGEYIIHCDSDDWLNKGYLQKVVDNMDPNYDKYMMNTISVFNDKYKEKAIWPNKGLKDYYGNELFEALCHRHKTSWALWGVTLKQSVLQQVYDAIDVSTMIIPSYDCLLSIAYSLFSKKSKYIPFDGFYYRINPNGVSFSVVTPAKLERTLDSEAKVFQTLYKILEKNKICISKLSKIKQELGNNFIHAFYQYENHKELFTQFSDKVYDTYGVILQKPKNRMKIIFFLKNLTLYRLLRSILMKLYRIMKP